MAKETSGKQETRETPTLGELLAAPKNHISGGDGVGDRPYVLCESGVRQPRQGDESRPRCPYHTTDALAVLCGATTTSSGITRYRCPVEGCTFTASRTRPGFGSRAAQQRTNDGPFVNRPQ